MRFVIPLLLLATSAQICDAQSLPLTIENIYGPRGRARTAAISPDGQWLAVSASGPDGVGIYLVPTTEQEPTTGVFWAAGSNPTWFADSKRIVFAYTSDLWTVDVGSTDVRRLTNDSHDERAAGPRPTDPTQPNSNTAVGDARGRGRSCPISAIRTRRRRTSQTRQGVRKSELPGEPHGLSSAARIDMYTRAEDFLNRYLKPIP